MTPLLIALFGLIGVAATAAGTWAIAKRAKSGRVETSEAETLWAESTRMREELRNEVVVLRAEVVSFRSEIVTMRADAVVTREEMERCRIHADRCDKELAKIRRTISEMRGS